MLKFSKCWKFYHFWGSSGIEKYSSKNFPQRCWIPRQCWKFNIVATTQTPKMHINFQVMRFILMFLLTSFIRSQQQHFYVEISTMELQHLLNKSMEILTMKLQNQLNTCVRKIQHLRWNTHWKFVWESTTLRMQQPLKIYVKNFNNEVTKPTEHLCV